MVKSRLIVSTLSLSAALFMSPTSISNAKEKILIEATPQTGWNATMIEGAKPENGYCALARQYNKGLILTLGQSVQDEYSLAIDFQDEKLNTEKPYKITLQPGPGEIRAYELMPASRQAMVVRLGYDESFFQSLEKSGQLTVGIDGKTYQFAASEMKKGRSDLKNCMAGLKGDGVVQTASNFSAEKIKNVEAVKAPVKELDKKVEKAVQKKPEIAVKAPAPKVPEKVEAKVEAKVAEASTKTDNSKKKIEISRVDSKAVALTPKMPDVKAPKVESAKVKAVQSIQKNVPEKPVVAEADVPKMADEKLSQNTKILQISKTPEIVSTRPDKVAAQGKKYGSVSNIKTKKLEQPVAPRSPEKVVVNKTAPVKSDIQISQAATTKAEKIVEKKETASPVLKKAEPKIDDAAQKKLEADLAQIKKENQRLSDALKNKNTQLSMVEKEAPKTELELEKAREKLKTLELENRRLYEESKKARGEIDTAVAQTSNQALRKMLDYEKKLEAAQADNLALSRELEEMRRLREDAQVSALSGEPAAQQSMVRYNEAKREIKRLGMLLEQQRIMHRQEKIELEDMLFDPAVADQAQRRKLAELQSKLQQAEARLQAEEKTMGMVPTAPVVPQKAPRVAPAIPLDMPLETQKRAVQNNIDEQAKLKALAEKERQLKAAEEKIKLEQQKAAQAQAKLAQAQRKEQELLAAERALALKTQQELEAVNEKKAELAAMETRLKQEREKNIAMKVAPSVPAVSKPVSLAPRAPMEKVVKQTSVSSKASQPSAPVAKVVQAPKPVVPSFGQGNIQSLLNQSGLSSVSKVVQKTPGQYSWNAAGMSGKAVVTNASQSLGQFAQSYLSQEQNNCRGDFASLPSTVPAGKQGYDIACIGPNNSKSASVVFVKKGADLIAITHETTADNMDAAIDARDNIAKKL